MSDKDIDASNASAFLPVDFNYLKGVFDHVSNGVTLTDANGKIFYVNHAFTDITGYDPQEVLGNTPGVLHSGRHDKVFYKAMWDKLLGEGRWQGEIWNRHKSGKIFPELLTITHLSPKEKNGGYYVAIFNDISFLKSDEMKRYHLALYDPLTLLPNRTLLSERFQQLLDNAPKSDFSATALLFIDLDHFKQVNDTYGHLVGDGLLQHVAKVLQSQARKGDTIVRYGGDEFVIMLPGFSTDEAVKAFCERIQAQLNVPVTIAGHDLRPEMGFGAAYFPREGDTLEHLIHAADKAMYHAKSNHLGLTFYHALPSK